MSSAVRARTSAVLTTPVKKVAVAAHVAESPGTWKHPRLDEIQRRRNASTFTEKNMRQVALSIVAFAMLYGVNYVATSYLSFDFLSKTTRSYFSWFFTIVHAAPIVNMAIALLPLVRPVDTLSDIPLSNEQRQLLGIPLNPAAGPSESAHVSTPPRYARTPSMAGSVNSRASYNGSPLSNRGSPMRGSEYSPYSSPLQYKSIKHSPMNTPTQSKVIKSAFLASSTSSNSSLISGSSPANMFADLGTPSPASKKTSVGLNSKWLYEKSRRQSGNWGQ